MLALVVAAAIAQGPVGPAPVGSAPVAPTPVDVYTIDPWIDGAIIGASLVTVAVPYVFPSAFITPRCPCDPDEIPDFDRFAVGLDSSIADVTSHVEVGLALAVPVVLDALDVGLDPVLWDDLVVYVEAIAVNGALVTLAKFSTKRPLPVVYAGLDRDLAASPYGYDAFYSGHVSNAVAALSAASMTYTLRHGLVAWPWVATAVVGTSVAIERVAAGQHFPSDVVVGAAAGLAVGTVVPWLHSLGGSLSVTPAENGATVSLRMPL